MMVAGEPRRARWYRWPLSLDRPLVWLPALAASAVYWPLFIYPFAVASEDTYRTHDWLASAKFDAFARISLLEWHTIPHWNPFLQGGMSQLAHPSDGSLSILVLPSLLLGEPLGMKINVVVCLMLGAVGTALLGRDRWGLRSGYAAFAGCLYAVAGWVPSRVSVGFYESSLFGVFPFIAWLFLQSRGRPWRLLAASVMLAFATMQMQLGIPVLMLALGLVLLFDIGRRAEPYDGLPRFLFFGIGGAALAAVKVLPMCMFLAWQGFRDVSEYPHDYDSWYFSMAQFWDSLLHVVPFPGLYDDHGSATLAEFGYLGLGLPAVLLFACALAFPRRVSAGAWAMAVVGVLFAWLSFGPNASVDLFKPLWSLPVFGSMRGPVRYTSFVVMWAACPLAAAGLQALAGGIRGRAVPPALMVVLAAGVLVWPAVQSAQRNSTSFTQRVTPPPPAEHFIQEELGSAHFGQSRGGSPRYHWGNVLKYANMKAGIGTVYEPEDLPADTTPEGWRIYNVDLCRYVPNQLYQGEAWCSEHECWAEVIEARANLIVVRAVLTQPDWVVINQQWHPAWRAAPTDADEVEGLVGAYLEEPGSVDVHFSFVSEGFNAGLVFSLGSLITGIVLVIRARRRNPPARA